MDTKNIIKLLASIFICELAGFVSSIFTAPSIGAWYAFLKKPFFTPPNFIFAPVWLLLFLLMGGALFLMWRSWDKKKDVRLSLIFFGIQLALNVFWTFLFFGLRNPFFAFVEIIFLSAAIALTIYQFSKVEKLASYMLFPYFLWVVFAAVLNYYIWILNA